MKRILFFIFLILFPSVASAVPSNTMSITPAAVDATVISASDENTRNNEVSTKFNAHDHNDIDQTGNTLSLGDATAGNKTIQANNADASKPYIRYDDTNNRWTISKDGSETSSIVTVSGADVAFFYLPDLDGTNGQTISLSSGVLEFTGMKNQGDLEVHNGTTRARLVPAQTGTSIVSQGQGQIPIFDFATKYFIGSFARDLSVASGTQGVTGVGFKPRLLIATATTNSTAGIASWGFSNITDEGGLSDNYNITTNSYLLNSGLVNIVTSSGNTTAGDVTSFDTDGFTMTWTRTGTPTGTITIHFIAIR